VSAEENRIMVRWMIEEVWNAHDHGAIDDFVARDYFNHAAVAEHWRGIEGARHIQRWLEAAFSDSRFDIEDIIADGDMVAIRGKASGTHDGEFMGRPPTGRRFSVDQVHWFRVAGGKVAEHWAVRDNMGHARQLGLIPEPGAAR